MKLTAEQINQIIEGLENKNTVVECILDDLITDDPRKPQTGICNIISKRGESYNDKMKNGIKTITQNKFILALIDNNICRFELVTKNKDKTETRVKI